MWKNAKSHIDLAKFAGISGPRFFPHAARLTVSWMRILEWSNRPDILVPGLKFEFLTTLFSNFYHFDQPLPSWQPLYNEDEEKAEEMEFFTIPAIIKRRTKYLVQNLNFFIQVQAATKVPSAITKT